MSKNPFLGLGMHTWTQKFDRNGGADIIYTINNNAEDFVIRSGSNTHNILIDWGDGSPLVTSTWYAQIHTYASAGIYKVKIYILSGTYRPYYQDYPDSAAQLIAVRVRTKPGVLGADFGGSIGVSMYNYLNGASNLVRYKQRTSASKLVNSFEQAWRGTSSLQKFPKIDTSNVRLFGGAWRNSGIRSFPKLDMSEAFFLDDAWRSCDNLTEFPSITFPKGYSFKNAWRSCDSLTTFPPNCFDSTAALSATAFQNAFKDCALSAQSIENILVSLVANGQTNVQLGLDGGTNAGAFVDWSAAALTAYNVLDSRGWTISYNQ